MNPIVFWRQAILLAWLWLPINAAFAQHPDMYAAYFTEMSATAVTHHYAAQGMVREQSDQFQFVDASTSEILHVLTKKKEHLQTDSDSPMLRYTYSYSKRHKYLLESAQIAADHSGPDTDLHTPKVVNRKLYRYPGNFIAELPAEVTTVRYAPDGSYFVAYGQGAASGMHLFFYTADGSLMNKVATHGSPQLHFSNNSDFVAAVDVYGSLVQLFDRQGSSCGELNHQQLMPTNAVVYNVIPDDSGEQLLFNFNGSQVLADLHGNVLWHRAGRRWVRAQFSADGKQVLLVQPPAPNEDRYCAEVLDAPTGNLITRVTNIELAEELNDAIILKKGGNYYAFKSN